MADAIWQYCEIRKASKDKTLRSLFVAGAWRAQSTLGRLGLEGLLLFVYSNLFTGELISTWRVTKRFFAEFFGFLFDNTSWCYLVFASLFPYSLSFIVYCCLLAYGLKSRSGDCTLFTFVPLLYKLE